jgi:glutamyl-tRNA reductase
VFHCYSVSHHTTPQWIREKLNFSREQQQTWLASVTPNEVVLLSTCNRLELYANVATHEQMEILWEDLLWQKAISAKDAESHTHKLHAYEAVHHLFQVTASLKSMALGEVQILGQVTNALEQASEQGTSKQATSLLFRSAIHAAKRVHSETHLSHGNVSVSSLAISHVEHLLGTLEPYKILVIGAGEMGEVLVKGLSHRHLHQVTLVSRTYERAKELAETWQMQACPLTQLKELLTEADVVFCASGAPFQILAYEDIAPILPLRSTDLYLVDIAVPRDVDPAINGLSGVHVFDLDGLQDMVEENLQARKQAIPHALAILEEELGAFWNHYQSIDIVPTIKQLRERAESIRDLELKRILNRLNQPNPDVNALFEEFSYRFMNKMLHAPIHNLKEKAGQGNGALVNAVVRDLFELEEKECV